MGRRLRRMRVLGAVAVIGALSLSGVAATSVPAEAASAPVRVTAVATGVGASGTLTVKVKCVSSKSCKGTVQATAASTKNTAKKFSIKAKKTATLKLTLTTKQLQAIHNASGNTRTVKVTARSTAPSKGTHSATKSVKLTAPLKVTSMDTTVTTSTTSNTSNTVGFAVACVSTATCKGSATMTLAGSKSAKVAISVAAKKSKSYRATLTTAQVTALQAANGERLGADLTVSLTAPMKLTVSGSSQVGTELIDEGGECDTAGDSGHAGHAGHGDCPEPGDPHSTAYKNSWSPSAYDTCTRAEHETFAVVGPDGRLYPGWHPAILTRTDGTTCTFGHEHGDDPSASTIYPWTMQQYAAEARANGRTIDALDEAAGTYLDRATGRQLGLPFGYGSERLNDYSEAHPEQAAVHRHEDDPGHKVVVSNQQVLGQEFRNTNGVTVKLTCDYLIKMHQGSHSSDATKNNTHELVYAVSCNDGTQLFATTMSQFGNANELHASCTRPFNSTQTVPLAVPTLGSTLPNGVGGKRYIPTRDCLEQYVLGGTATGTGPQDDLRGTPVAGSTGWWWAGYEQWQSFNTITSADGTELARYEPWFGIQNPARYYAGNGATDTVVGYLSDLAWETGNQQAWEPWASQLAASPESAIDKKSPSSWFNGSIRDAWLARTLVKNKAGTQVLFADPWGGNAQTTQFPGSMRVVVSAVDNSGWVKDTRPSVTRRFQHADEGLVRNGATGQPALGFFYDYGTVQGLGVHMPN